MRNQIGGLLLAGVLLAAVLQGGCGAQPGDTRGQVVLALSLPGGVTIASVDWKVFSAASPTVAVASGTINTSNGSATASVNLSLAQGGGYTVSMTTTTSEGAPCAGTSSAFNVIPGATSVPVAVTIACGNVTPSPSVGQIVVTGTVVAGDNCPVLVSSVISPEATAANGGTIDVSVSASDADPGESVSYTWAAPAGSFSNLHAATTQYLCGPVGSESLSVSITDNHLPTPCSVTVTFPPVRCL
jgi:hypothetical protein